VLLLLFLSIVSLQNVFSQNTNKQLCILFSENSKYVSVKTDTSTQLTLISFPRKGYENPEKAKEAFIYWRHHGKSVPSPQFVFEYATTKKPIKISSLKNLQ